MTREVITANPDTSLHIHEIQESLRQCRVRSLDLLHQAVSFLKQELEFAAGDVAAEQSKAAPAVPSGESLVGTNSSHQECRLVAPISGRRIRSPSLPMPTSSPVLPNIDGSVLFVETLAQMTPFFNGGSPRAWQTVASRVPIWPGTPVPAHPANWRCSVTPRRLPSADPALC